MSALVIVEIILFVFILSILVVLIVLDQHNEEVKIIENIVNIKNLDSMIKMAKDTLLQEDRLKDLAISFINTQKFYAKKNEMLDEDAKSKLKFISAFASNPNVSERLINFLSNELIKRYEDYKEDINTYEKIGIRKRYSNY